MILPGGIIGGAPRLLAEVTSVSFASAATGTSFTISSLNWGDEVKGANVRSIIVTLLLPTDRNISGTPTINGLNATVIFNDVTPNVSGTGFRFVAFAVDVPTGSSGDVVFAISGSATTPPVAVFRAINLDVSTETDSDINAAANLATLAIDCPAGGAIIGQGFYSYSGGSTPTSADFANLDTLVFIDASVGGTQAGSVFASAQTGLDVTFDPTPNTNLTRSHAFALAFARTY